MAYYSEDYRELVESARDAVEELLKGSTVDSWLKLREGYGEIRHMLTLDDRWGELERQRREREEHKRLSATDREQVEEQHRKWLEQKAIWKSVSKAERERVAIELIGEGRLTLAELKDKFQEHYGFDGTIYDTHVRPIAMRLVAAGELEREAERFQGKVRYRFFRKRDLKGPIADLERAYNGDGEA